MKKQYRLLKVMVMETAVVLLVQWALLHWLAHKQVVATVLAAGEHVPRVALMLPVVFLLIRFLALFILPGVVCSRLVQIVFCIYVENPRELADAQRQVGTETNPAAAQ